MKRDHRKLFSRTTPLIFLLVILLLYVDFLWIRFIRFDEFYMELAGTQYISTSKTTSIDRLKIRMNETVKEYQDSIDFLLSRLVKGEDQEKLRTTGFVCNPEVHSIHCVTNKPVGIDTRSMTVSIPSNLADQESVVRPYARREDEVLLRSVTPVRILQGNVSLPVCQYNHQIPAIIFSSSGFVGNIFHEINEILIPLYITTKMFKSQVQFILLDYNPSFVRKYGKALDKLSDYPIINPAINKSVHCFPGGVIGLKFHGHLSLNSSDIPKGHSMQEFRQFLRKSFGLKFDHVSQIRRPTVMLLSRRTMRRFLNEEEMVSTMEELGFRVIVIARAKTISNLRLFANYINSCSVFVGIHGAGLTNELFLPDGAVMVQIDLIGLAWAAATYYGNPARAMNVHYLRYKIEPEESSISKVYGSPNHTVLTDFHWLSVEAGREVYLNGQNVRVNIARFRETMVQAMSLL
ncbi:alpha-1,3-arabinosyltransferase XAT3-like isoform X1 [Primulina eburnea]|uniref:alpha-1,3-arabinosyltransferase XAT3-like isoform X1 n=1 Tax=Primulina eburnea TaxID=1245227 RepID=UPI003C6C564A